MDESQFLRALKPYYEAFAERDPEIRIQLLRTAMTMDAEIWGPNACSPATGRYRRRSQASTRTGPAVGWFSRRG